MTVTEKLNKCHQSIKSKIDFTPRVAIVLGSGLGALADEIQAVATLDYSEIDGFPQSTVFGHKGRFVFGRIADTPVVIMQGRVHFYEGYAMSDVVLPIRLMRLMGAEILLLTNAAGGINAAFSAGDFMLITDQISSFAPNPLIGENIDQLGTRFPDMSEIYNKGLSEIIRNVAAEHGIKLHEGVYLQTTGPAFESPAEIKMYRILGADAVGMSTACEATAANHAGFKVAGISFIANLACGMTDNPLTHDEVMEAGEKSAPLFRELVRGVVEKM
ncbi:MAG: purine-nucleoside phosphorylase [Oscillospiraceae bacterium]|nr:purine-nucleoside phosphorylase [Oscillospiraceae bacterium]